MKNTATLPWVASVCIPVRGADGASFGVLSSKIKIMVIRMIRETTGKVLKRAALQPALLRLKDDFSQAQGKPARHYNHH